MTRGNSTAWPPGNEDNSGEPLGTEAARGSVMQRVTVPATAIETAPERTTEERLADRARQLLTQPGIIGAARWSTRADDVEAFGALSRTMAERASYFAEIGRRIGSVFGFVGLREVHLSGETRRLVLSRHESGNVLCVMTTTEVETTEASRALRGDVR